MKTSWLGRRDEVSKRSRWSREYAGRGVAGYLRVRCETRVGVGEGVFGGRGWKKRLVVELSA